jgi:uracil phosphoribosyltransferase
MKSVSRAWNTSSNDIKNLVSALSSTDLSVESYRHTMYSIGRAQGEELVRVLETQTICVACTVEDADFLVKGLIDSLNDHGKEVVLVCFWNKRISFGDGVPSSAPILKVYEDEGVDSTTELVVVKSIISGGCVVKTNLTSLIKSVDPERIFVVAPVIRQGAQERLSAEFPSNISSKFEYRYLAIVDKVDEVGNVVPGIGGLVYERLGFEDEAKKNKIMPKLVEQRIAV